jgi:hypothetical protein
MKRILAAVVLAMGFNQVHAANDEGDYVVHGHGKHTCADFVANRSSLFTQTYYFVWLQGYMTHYNMETPDTQDVWQDMDFNGAMLWIENYCRNNPPETINAAALAQIKELYPKRLR